VALMAAFVFRVPWLVPGLSLLLAVGAVAGPRANVLHRACERWITPRLPPVAAASEGAVPAHEPTVAVSTVRAQDAIAAAIVAVASLAFLFGVAILGWALALAEAVIAIIAATTRLHVGDRLRHFF